MTSKAQAKRNRKGPKSPEQIQAERLAQRVRDFEAVGLAGSSAALPQNDEVTVERGDQSHEERARRGDVFDLLKADMASKAPGAYDAARRLTDDIAQRQGEADRGRPTERVDGGGHIPGCTDAQVDAGRRVDWVMRNIGARDAWLLDELIAKRLDRREVTRRTKGGADKLTVFTGWRAIVAYVTGEENEVAQAACVRSACANLSQAYRAWDDLNRIAA